MVKIFIFVSAVSKTIDAVTFAPKITLPRLEISIGLTSGDIDLVKIFVREFVGFDQRIAARECRLGGADAMDQDFRNV